MFHGATGKAAMRVSAVYCVAYNEIETPPPVNSRIPPTSGRLYFISDRDSGVRNIWYLSPGNLATATDAPVCFGMFVSICQFAFTVPAILFLCAMVAADTGDGLHLL